MSENNLQENSVSLQENSLQRNGLDYPERGLDNPESDLDLEVSSPEIVDQVVPSSSSDSVLDSSPESSPAPEHTVAAEEGEDAALVVHYKELLRVISVMGTKVRPCYTGNQSCMEELTNGINMAESVLKQCQQDLDELEANSS